MDVETVTAQIKEKYHYDDWLSTTLHNTMNAMITYYGEENKDKILNTFIETPIGFFKTDKEVETFYKLLGIKEPNKMPLVGAGGYLEKFQLNDSNQLERIPSVLLRIHDNENILNLTETVVHEMCHAFMNYGKAKEQDGVIISRTGIINDITSLDGKESIVKNIQVEEGMNEYDALNITEMICGEKLKAVGYGQNVKYVSPLMNNESIRKIVNTSRINGDDNWKEIFGIELADRYIQTFEDYVACYSITDISQEERAIKKEAARKKMLEAYNEVINIVNTYSVDEIITK